MIPNGFTQKLSQVVPPARIKPDAPLAPYTYMKVGGPAQLLVETTTQPELIKTFQLIRDAKLKYLILGGGSNIIINDLGIDGVVIKVRSYNQPELEWLDNHQRARVTAEAGLLTNQLAQFCISQGLTGMEFFLGIPGTVGGAVYNNSHYQHQLIGDYLCNVQVIEPDGQVVILYPQQLDLGYDRTSLQNSGKIILNAAFELNSGDPETIAKKAAEYTKLRAASQPLGLASSGCIFKNITDEDMQRLQLPTKSAGYLIEQAGLKGTSVGGIAVSDKHANFFINRGQGTAGDIEKLMSLVSEKVLQKFGIQLIPEVFFIGKS
jgi:UDP-N-acetylmuramate dehydrogenase